jgi:hypothetical protein
MPPLHPSSRVSALGLVLLLLPPRYNPSLSGVLLFTNENGGTALLHTEKYRRFVVGLVVWFVSTSL